MTKVTVAQYAKLRGIRRQSVYKALKRYGIPKVGTKFDMVALDRARERQGDPARQLAQAQEPASPTAEFAACRARREQAQAELAEINLAQRKGELVEVQDVEEAMILAGRRIRDELDRLPAQAEEVYALALDSDPRKLRRFLREQVRRLETTIADAFRL